MQGQRCQWQLIHTSQPFLRITQPGTRGAAPAQCHGTVWLWSTTPRLPTRFIPHHPAVPPRRSRPQLHSATLQGDAVSEEGEIAAHCPA